MENRKKPRIRFKGFTNAWEQCKLQEVIEEYIEKTTIQNQYPVLTSSQQKGIILQEEYFSNRQITTNDNIGYYVLPYGYFTYRSRSDTDIFVFNRNNIINKGIISYFYPVFSAKNVDATFLLYRLNNGTEKQIRIAAEGTGQHVLSIKKFKEIKALFPLTEEQTQIGKTLETVDKLLTLHQRKCEKLQNIKKSLLEKMFPKNNKKYPEIRFKGFTNAWEHQTFLETFDYSIPNNTLSRANLNDEEGIIKNIHYGDILVKYGDIIKISKSNIPYITDGDLNIYKNFLLQDGDIVIADTAEDETTGKAVEISDVQDNFVVAGLHTIVCRPKKKKQQYFLGYYINSSAYHRQLLPLLQGIKVYSISKSNLAKTYIKFPTAKKEQANIGKLFLKIDKLLTLHQQQINKLQNIKKALLEKMFV